MGPLVSAAQLVEVIRDLDSPAIVGIEGFGGSGKSTLALTLAAAIDGCVVIPMDDFIVKEHVLDPRWDDGAYDHERLRREVLAPARSGVPISYRRLEWESNTLSEPIHVPSANVVIVEGITAYHPRCESFYDLRVWIDTPLDIAKERGRQRDAGNENEAHWDQWAATDAEHARRNRPRERADYLVSGIE